MAENYPKMLYDRDYATHCDEPNHDHERAQKKRACTVTVQNPDDHAAKVAEGYRESYADDFGGEVEAPVADVEQPLTPPARVNGRRAAVKDTPKLEG